MEASYIVRIYRRESNMQAMPRGVADIGLVGIVEEVRSGKRSPFRNAGELLGILAEGIQPVELDSIPGQDSIK